MNENLLNKYEKYYQNGGTYVIPAEIFCDLVDELEQANTTIDYKSAYDNVMVANDMLRKENDRLKQEIKEIKDKLNCDLKWAFRYDELFIENQELHNKIDKAIKYVSQLSSKGRDCEIYWDIKQEILKILKGDVNE